MAWQVLPGSDQLVSGFLMQPGPGSWLRKTPIEAAEGYGAIWLQSNSISTVKISKVHLYVKFILEAFSTSLKAWFSSWNWKPMKTKVTPALGVLEFVQMMIALGFIIWPRPWCDYEWHSSITARSQWMLTVRLLSPVYTNPRLSHLA